MEQKNSKKTQEILDVLNYKTIGGTLLRLFGVGVTLCNHPIDKRASFKSHGKDFCWKCGKHI